MAKAVPPHRLIEWHYKLFGKDNTQFRDINDYKNRISQSATPQMYEQMSRDLKEYFYDDDPAYIDEITGMTKWREDTEKSWVGNVARGIGDRATNLAGGLIELIDIAQKSVGLDYEPIEQTAEWLRNKDFGYEEWTTWDDVKNGSALDLIAFAFEKGLVSVPDMAAVLTPGVGLPAYIAARTGEIAQERAINNDMEQASGLDALAAFPAATASAVLDRLGARAILGIGKSLKAGKQNAKGEIENHKLAVEKLFDPLPKGKGVKAFAGAVGRAGAVEAATEAAQESIEYAGATIGTERGFDGAEAGESALIGAVVGGIFGGSVRGVTAAGQQVTGRTQEERDAAKAETDYSDRHMSNVELNKEYEDGAREIIPASALKDGMDVVVSPHDRPAKKGTVKEKEGNVFDIIGDDGSVLMADVPAGMDIDGNIDIFSQNESDFQEDIDPEQESFSQEVNRLIKRQQKNQTESGVEALNAIRKDKRFEKLDAATKDTVDDLIDGLEMDKAAEEAAAAAAAEPPGKTTETVTKTVTQEGDKTVTVTEKETAVEPSTTKDAETVIQEEDEWTNFVPEPVRDAAARIEEGVYDTAEDLEADVDALKSFYTPETKKSAPTSVAQKIVDLQSSIKAARSQFEAEEEVEDTPLSDDVKQASTRLNRLRQGRKSWTEQNQDDLDAAKTAFNELENKKKKGKLGTVQQNDYNRLQNVINKANAIKEKVPAKAKTEGIPQKDSEEIAAITKRMEAKDYKTWADIIPDHKRLKELRNKYQKDLTKTALDRIDKTLKEVEEVIERSKAADAKAAETTTAPTTTAETTTQAPTVETTTAPTQKEKAVQRKNADVRLFRTKSQSEFRAETLEVFSKLKGWRDKKKKVKGKTELVRMPSKPLPSKVTALIDEMYEHGISVEKLQEDPTVSLENFNGLTVYKIREGIRKGHILGVKDSSTDEANKEGYFAEEIPAAEEITVTAATPETIQPRQLSDSWKGVLKPLGLAFKRFLGKDPKQVLKELEEQTEKYKKAIRDNPEPGNTKRWEQYVKNKVIEGFLHGIYMNDKNFRDSLPENVQNKLRKLVAKYQGKDIERMEKTATLLFSKYMDQESLSTNNKRVTNKIKSKDKKVKAQGSKELWSAGDNAFQAGVVIGRFARMASPVLGQTATAAPAPTATAPPATATPTTTTATAGAPLWTFDNNETPASDTTTEPDTDPVLEYPSDVQDAVSELQDILDMLANPPEGVTVAIEDSEINELFAVIENFYKSNDYDVLDDAKKEELKNLINDVNNQRKLQAREGFIPKKDSEEIAAITKRMEAKDYKTWADVIPDYERLKELRSVYEKTLPKESLARIDEALIKVEEVVERSKDTKTPLSKEEEEEIAKVTNIDTKKVKIILDHLSKYIPKGMYKSNTERLAKVLVIQGYDTVEKAEDILTRNDAMLLMDSNEGIDRLILNIFKESTPTAPDKPVTAKTPTNRKKEVLFNHFKRAHPKHGKNPLLKQEEGGSMGDLRLVKLADKMVDKGIDTKAKADQFIADAKVAWGLVDQTRLDILHAKLDEMPDKSAPSTADTVGTKTAGRPAKFTRAMENALSQIEKKSEQGLDKAPSGIKRSINTLSKFLNNINVNNLTESDKKRFNAVLNILSGWGYKINREEGTILEAADLVGGNKPDKEPEYTAPTTVASDFTFGYEGPSDEELEYLASEAVSLEEMQAMGVPEPAEPEGTGDTWRDDIKRKLRTMRRIFNETGKGNDENMPQPAQVDAMIDAMELAGVNDMDTLTELYPGLKALVTQNKIVQITRSLGKKARQAGKVVPAAPGSSPAVDTKQTVKKDGHKYTTGSRPSRRQTNQMEMEWSLVNKGARLAIERIEKDDFKDLADFEDAVDTVKKFLDDKTMSRQPRSVQERVNDLAQTVEALREKYTQQDLASKKKTEKVKERKQAVEKTEEEKRLWSLAKEFKNYLEMYWFTLPEGIMAWPEKRQQQIEDIAIAMVNNRFQEVEEIDVALLNILGDDKKLLGDNDIDEIMGQLTEEIKALRYTPLIKKTSLYAKMLKEATEYKEVLELLKKWRDATPDPEVPQEAEMLAKLEQLALSKVSTDGMISAKIDPDTNVEIEPEKRAPDKSQLKKIVSLFASKRTAFTEQDVQEWWQEIISGKTFDTVQADVEIQKLEDAPDPYRPELEEKATDPQLKKLAYMLGKAGMNTEEKVDLTWSYLDGSLTKGEIAQAYKNIYGMSIKKIKGSFTFLEGSDLTPKYRFVHAMKRTRNFITSSIKSELRQLFGRLVPEEDVGMLSFFYARDVGIKTLNGMEMQGGYFPNNIFSKPKIEMVLDRMASVDEQGEWTTSELMPMQVLAHEMVHYMRDTGRITDKEWDILKKAVDEGDLMTKYHIRERYAVLAASGNEEMLYEEAVAEAFGDLVYEIYSEASLKERTTEKIKEANALKKWPAKFRDQIYDIINKVLDTFQKMASRYKLDEKAKRHATYTDLMNDIFADIMMGNVGKRRKSLRSQTLDAFHGILGSIEYHLGRSMSEDEFIDEVGMPLLEWVDQTRSWIDADPRNIELAIRQLPAFFEGGKDRYYMPIMHGLGALLHNKDVDNAVVVNLYKLLDISFGSVPANPQSNVTALLQAEKNQKREGVRRLITLLGERRGDVKEYEEYLSDMSLEEIESLMITGEERAEDAQRRRENLEVLPEQYPDLYVDDETATPPVIDNVVSVQDGMPHNDQRTPLLVKRETQASVTRRNFLKFLGGSAAQAAMPDVAKIVKLAMGDGLGSKKLLGSIIKLDIEDYLASDSFLAGVDIKDNFEQFLLPMFNEWWGKYGDKRDSMSLKDLKIAMYEDAGYFDAGLDKGTFYGLDLFWDGVKDTVKQHGTTKQELFSMFDDLHKNGLNHLEELLKPGSPIDKELRKSIEKVDKEWHERHERIEKVNQEAKERKRQVKENQKVAAQFTQLFGARYVDPELARRRGSLRMAMQADTRASATVNLKKTKPEDEPYVSFSNPVSEDRFRKAQEGLEPKGFVEKLMEKVKDILTNFRHFKYTQVNEYNALVIEKMKHLETSPHNNLVKAEVYIKKVGKHLKDKRDLDLFTRAVILPDLEYHKDLKMPFDLTKETLPAELDKVNAAVEKNSAVKKALKVRNAEMEKVRRQLVTHGVLSEERVKNVHYFRRQVLEYAQLMDGSQKGKKKIATTSWYKREGSEKDINANYFQNETEYLFQAYQSIENQKFINWLRKSKYNMKPKYKELAKENNRTKVDDALYKDLTEGLEHIRSVVEQGNVPIQFSNMIRMAKRKNRQSFDIAKNELVELLAGDLQREDINAAYKQAVKDGYFSQVEKLLSANRHIARAASIFDAHLFRLIEHRDELEAEVEFPRFIKRFLDRQEEPNLFDTQGDTNENIFKIYAWFAQQQVMFRDNDPLRLQVEASRMLLKAIGMKTKLNKELAGDEYIDPMNDQALIKAFGEQGQVTWQPDARTANDRAIHVFLSKSIGEHMYDKVTDQVFNEMGREADVDEEQWKAVRGILEESSNFHMVQGNLKETFILPDYLSDQFNNFRMHREEGAIGNASASTVVHLKKWMLFSPWRVPKYTLNNLVGDNDAMLATFGNTDAFRYLGQAFRELGGYLYSGKEPSARLHEALHMGVVHTNLTTQDIPMAMFRQIEKTGRIDVKEMMPKDGRSWNVYKKYFDTVMKAITLREAAFRYASYLNYHNKIVVQNKTALEVGFGASYHKMVKGLEGNKLELAAMLSRDAMGDYNNISVYGQFIRNHLVMFWSWMESNFRRYKNLTQNAVVYANYRGGLEGWAGMKKGIAPSVLLSASMGVRIAAWYSLLQFYNHFIHGDDEEYLDEDSWQMKVKIPSPNPDEVWEVRIQGALSDVMGWFGAEDIGSLIAQYQRGVATIPEILQEVAKAPPNRLLQSINPIIKVPMELISGNSFFPDVFNPLSIRDPWEHTIRTWSLHREYRWLANKMGLMVPTRPYFDNIHEFIFYRRDKNEIAYDTVRNWAYQYKKSEAQQRDKTVALRNLKRARRFGDKKTEQDIIRELAKEFDYTQKNFNRIRRGSDPLAVLNKDEKLDFLHSLSPLERLVVPQAYDYYEQRF